MPRTTKTKSNPRRHPRSLPQNNQPCFVGRFGCPSARARCEDLGVCALGIQSSVSRKHKCLLGGVRPVASHESDEPRRSNTPGSFLGKRSRHPRQSLLIGESRHRCALSSPAALSVSEGAIGIPLLFCVFVTKAKKGGESKYVLVPDSWLWASEGTEQLQRTSVRPH